MFALPVKRPPTRAAAKAPAAGLVRGAPDGRTHSGGGAPAALDFGRISIYPPNGAQAGVEAPRLQRKLRVGRTDDPLEQEADRAAEQVIGAEGGRPMLSQAPPRVSRLGSDEASAASTADAPALVDEVLRSPGRPLDAAARAELESRFGRSFADVRVRTDARASESARALDSRAYTVGKDIAFQSGSYAPGTPDGRRLLAHELAHVVQQGSVGAAAPALVQREPPRRSAPPPEDPFTPVEQWVGPNEFSVRRELVPLLTDRGTPPSMEKNLPEIFQDSHPWPLQWSGDEIRIGRFYSSRDFNAGAMKRIENAGKNLARLANPAADRPQAGANQGLANTEKVRIRATVSVSRYPEAKPETELNLLERATYRFESVSREGDGWKIEPLGEVTVIQRLSQKQRTALLEGTLLAESTKEFLRYQLGKDVVTIDTKKLAVIPPDDVHTAGGEGATISLAGALQKDTEDAPTPREKQTRQAERDAARAAAKDLADRNPQEPIDEAAVARQRIEADRIAAARRQGVRQTPPPIVEPTAPVVEPAARVTTEVAKPTVGGGRTEPVAHAQVGEQLEPVHEGSVGGGGMEAIGGAGGLIQSGLYQSLEHNQAAALDAKMKTLKPFIDPEVDRGNSVEITIVEEAPDSVDLIAGPTGTSDQGQITYFRDAFISAIVPPRTRARQDDASGPSMRDAGSRPPPSKGGSTLTQDQITGLKAKNTGHHVTFRTQTIPEPSLHSDLTYGADAPPVETPFPKIALARFKPGSEALKNVQFKLRDFDDLGTEQLTVGKRPLSFYILKLPSKLRLANDPFSDTSVSFIDTTTADGFDVHAIDLDPWIGKLPGNSHTKVLAIFPADERTARLFATTPSTKDKYEKVAYVNFDAMRWAYADDVEIVEVYDKTQFKAPDATLPAVETSEVQSQLAKAPEPVRALYYSMTSKGKSTTASDFLERFLAAVPSDLTDEEVESLTKNLRHSSNVGDSLNALSQSIQALRAKRSSGAAPPQNTPPPVPSEAVAGVVRARMAVVDWSAVTETTVFSSEQKSFFLDDYQGRQGQRVETFAYGLDEQKRRWGALVTVKVGATAKGLTPVTVVSSSALISQTGEALYANSAIWGATLTLQALKRP